MTREKDGTINDEGTMDLMESVTELDVSLSNAKARKRDWKNFLVGLKKNSLPSNDELAMVLKNLGADEQAMFSTILLDIEADSPSMSSYQKKFLALGMSSMLNVANYESRVMELGLRVGLNDRQIKELEAKSKFLGVLQNKQKYLMEHINKHQEIKSNNGGALDEILNDPDLLDFQLMVRKKGSKGNVVEKEIKTINAEDAEYRDVEDEE